MIPENSTVRYRCKTCRACFFSMKDINRHLYKTNHIIRSSEDTGKQAGNSGTSTSSASPNSTVEKTKLVQEADLVMGPPTNEGDINSSTNAVDEDIAPLNMSIKDRLNEKEDALNGEEGKASLSKTCTDSVRNSLDTLQKKLSAVGDMTQKAPTEQKERSEVEEMEIDSDSKAVIGSNKESWMAVTKPGQNGAVEAKKEVNAIISDERMENMEIADATSVIPVPVGKCDNVPDKDDRAEKSVPSSNNELKTIVNEKIVNASDSGESKGKPQGKIKSSESPQGKIKSSESPKGKIKSPEKLQRDLAEATSKVKAKLIRQKWRDVQTTAFTYSPNTSVEVKVETKDNPDSDPTELKETSEEETDDKLLYKCPYCDEKFALTIQVLNHKRRMHTLNTETTKSKRDTKARKNSNHRKKKPTAAVKQKGQGYPLRSLSTRTRRSTSTADYTYGIDNKKLPKKSARFTCNHCSKKFATLTNLKQHIHTLHPETTRKPIVENNKTKTLLPKRLRSKVKRRATSSNRSTSSNFNETTPTLASSPNSLVESSTSHVEVVNKTSDSDNSKPIIKGPSKRRESQHVPTKETLFTCKHCGEKFPLLNSLRTHHRQVHPDTFGKNKVKVKTEIEMSNGSLTSLEKSQEVRVTRNQHQQDMRRSSVSDKKSERKPSTSSSRRSSSSLTKRNSDVKMNLNKPKPNISNQSNESLMKEENENRLATVGVEEEPDGFVDTAETILAALTSTKSQTCPYCMKIFRFAGGLINHLKVCEDVDLDMDVECSTQTQSKEMCDIPTQGENDPVENIKEDDEIEEKESASEKIPYYKQVGFRKCWECDMVVARFYNLKRHLMQVHKVKMSTNDIHARQAQLLGVPIKHRGIKKEA